MKLHKKFLVFSLVIPIVGFLWVFTILSKTVGGYAVYYVILLLRNPIVLLLLTTLGVINIFLGKKYKFRPQFWIGVIVLLISTLTFFQGYALPEYRLEKSIANRGFAIYLPYNTNIDDLELPPSELNYASDPAGKAYFRYWIYTPKGVIGLVESGVDYGVDYIVENLFIPPDKCDYDRLFLYISPLHKTPNGSTIWPIEGNGESAPKKHHEPTDITCRVVYESNDTILLLGNTLIPDYNVPYIARIGDTIIVFASVSSLDSYPTNGRLRTERFTGTKEEALSYIIDFLKNSRVFTDDELGL